MHPEGLKFGVNFSVRKNLTTTTEGDGVALVSDNFGYGQYTQENILNEQWKHGLRFNPRRILGSKIRQRYQKI